MQLVHDSHDSKVKYQSYEAEREYSMLKVNTCSRLARPPLNSRTIPLCEMNYKDEC